MQSGAETRQVNEDASMMKAISTSQTQSNIKAVLEILADIPVKLDLLSEGLSSAQLQAPPGKGERSFQEDVVHLINCEALTSQAIYLALLVDEPLVVSVHPERHWGKLLQFEQFEFSELLTYFTFRRKVLLSVLHTLNDQKWGRVIREEGKKRKESVYWQARTLALHEWEHVRDLEQKHHPDRQLL
jgi:hypothetical protein